MTVAQWVPNLGRRLGQLARIQQSRSFHEVEVWLGGLFFPEAYITATRQAVSHRRNWSLETLRLQVDLEKIQDPNAFVIEGWSQKKEPLLIIHSPLLQACIWKALLGHQLA
jgi:dynein heavy chain 1